MEPLLSPEEIDALFGLAGLGIRAGLGGEGPPALDLHVLSPALCRPGGAFVTLEIDGQLNGCIGSVVPANLRPGVDGVLIRWGAHDATFLPAVWQKLPDPVTFLRHLEAKAGLHPARWPRGIEGWRYQTADHRRRAVDIDSRSAA